MKLRSKKLFTMLVATFVAVVMAGGVLAFGVGTLVFEGRANVTSEMRVIVTEAFGTGLADVDGYGRQYAPISADGKTVTFTTVPFSRYGDEATLRVRVENVGDVDVQFTNFLQAFAFDNLPYVGVGGVPFDIDYEIIQTPATGFMTYLPKDDYMIIEFTLTFVPDEQWANHAAANTPGLDTEINMTNWPFTFNVNYAFDAW